MFSALPHQEWREGVHRMMTVALDAGECLSARCAALRFLTCVLAMATDVPTEARHEDAHRGPLGFDDAMADAEISNTDPEWQVGASSHTVVGSLVGEGWAPPPHQIQGSIN